MNRRGNVWHVEFSHFFAQFDWIANVFPSFSDAQEKAVKREEVTQKKINSNISGSSQLCPRKGDEKSVGTTYLQNRPQHINIQSPKKVPRAREVGGERPRGYWSAPGFQGGVEFLVFTV